MLKEARIPFRAVHVADITQQSEIVSKVNAKSFPLVFVKDQYVGGFTHIVLLHSQGRLHELAAAEAPVEQQAKSLAPSPPPNAAPSSSGVGALRDEIAGYARWGDLKKRAQS
jgi:glutaredoxin